MTDYLPAAALILVDVQNDFCPGGALAVSEGDRIVPVINSLMPSFGLIIAALDWHPAKHISFREQGGPWPPHCVQNTDGAALHPELETSRISNTFRKATAPDADAYSEFEGKDESGRSLDEYLKSLGVRKVILAGLATDYCVRATALDALRLGYDTTVVTDAVRAVNVQEGDGGRALAEIEKSGAHLVSSSELQRRGSPHRVSAAD